MSEHNSVSKSNRIEVVDALRGFAVVAILLVHCIEHYIYTEYPETSNMWLWVLDSTIDLTVMSLFAGKSYAIFAILFGLTFHIQSSRRKKDGKDFGYRFLWRLVLLVGFGTLNAAFFPGGDVLLLFSVAGPGLFLTRNWSDKALLIGAIIFLLQPVEWFHFVADAIDSRYEFPDLKVDEMYNQLKTYTQAGNFWDSLIINITIGQKASLLWAVNGGRFFQTIGLFLLGAWLGRKELFVANEKNLRSWTMTLIVSAIMFAPLYSLKELVMTKDLFFGQTIGAILDMWQKLAFAFVLISSFILLYQKDKFQKAVSGLRYYGRMSLSNYIGQSIFGGLVFFPIGLNLAPVSGYFASLIIALVIAFLQISFSKWWLSHHRQGPLEWLWHRWTWIGTKK